MNAKVAKIGSKIGIGILSAVAIGYTIKGEKMLGEKIDEKFDDTPAEEQS